MDLKAIKSLAVVCGALAAWLAWGFAVLGVAYPAVGLQQLRAARKSRPGMTP